MAMPVVTVASGGLPVVDVTATTGRGVPVSEALPSRGAPVTKVASGGMSVVYSTVSDFPGQPGSAPETVTWDPVTAVNAVASGGNLTATHSNVSSGGICVGVFASSGKYYFEIKNQTVIASQDTVGIMLSGINVVFQSDPGTVVVVFTSVSTLFANNVDTGVNFGLRALGDIYGVAVDLSSRLIWFRRNGGNWNMSAPANQATGVGGISFTAGSYTPKAAFASSTSGQVAVANFGATAYANAAPSSFNNWPAAPSVPVLTNFATFNGTPSAGIVMSNGNLTVTHGTTNNAAGAFSTTYLTTGKYYFEVTASPYAGGSHKLGIMLSTGTLIGMSGNDNKCMIAVPGANTFIYTNGASTGKNIGTAAAGNVFGFAIDLTNRLAWIRRNNGNWNGDVAADPVTGANGVALVAGNFAPAVVFTNTGATDAFIGNFGQSAFAFTAPSNFALGWGT
jgi:hypothetical protein